MVFCRISSYIVTNKSWSIKSCYVINVALGNIWTRKLSYILRFIGFFGNNCMFLKFEWFAVLNHLGYANNVTLENNWIESLSFMILYIL